MRKSSTNAILQSTQEEKRWMEKEQSYQQLWEESSQREIHQHLTGGKGEGPMTACEQPTGANETESALTLASSWELQHIPVK